MIEIGVIGAAGRMGRTIVACIEDSEGVAVCCGTEAPGNSGVGRDVGELAGIGPKGIAVQSRQPVPPQWMATDPALEYSKSKWAWGCS